MRTSLTIVTPPAVEPISVAEMKSLLHLDTSYTADDTVIAGLISSARRWVEEYLNRSLATQTLEYRLDRFPRRGGVIQLPRGPWQSIISFVYIIRTGVERLMSPGYDYVFDPVTGRIVPPSGRVWPSDEVYDLGAVQIQYVAGYDDGDVYSTTERTPETALQAIRALVCWHWINRVPMDGMAESCIQAVRHLLDPIREVPA